MYGKKAMIDELPGLVVEFDVSGLEKSGTYEAKVIVPDGVTVKENTIKIQANVRKDSVEADSEPAEDETAEDNPTEDEPAQTEEDNTQ